MPLRFFVFDLDGTLIDSRSDLAGSVNALLTEVGATALPESTVADMVGDGAAVLVHRALASARVDLDRGPALRRFLEIYEGRLLDNTDCYPGLREALHNGARHNVPLAVLTNKPERATLRILDGLNLSHLFLAVVGGDGSFPRKPNPAALQYLVRAAHAPLEATWLVGDSPIDAETARRAGVRFCAARYGFGWRKALNSAGRISRSIAPKRCGN